MALTNTQKDNIKRRALAGETGASLAAEFGVSQSAISKIKNYHEFTTAAASASRPSISTAKKPAVEVSAKTAEVQSDNSSLIKCVVSSTKIINKTVYLKPGSTLGDLITACEESGSLEGVFKNTEAGERARVKKLTDVIPAQAGETYSVYLLPLKSDSGL